MSKINLGYVLVGLILIYISQSCFASEKWDFKKGYFVENKSGLVDEKIKFLSKRAFGNVYIGKQDITYQFIKNNSTKNFQQITEGEFKNKDATIDIVNIKQTFINASFENSRELISGQNSTSNYLLGNISSGWITNLKNSNGIVFQNI